MKLFIFLVFSFGVLTTHAQSDKYMDAMKKNLSRFDSVKTTADYQGLSAAFERIGDAEKTQWLPYYYAGLALTTAGWQDAKLDKEANAEKIKALDSAIALEKKYKEAVEAGVITTGTILRMNVSNEEKIKALDSAIAFEKKYKEAVEAGVTYGTINRIMMMHSSDEEKIKALDAEIKKIKGQ